MIYAINSIAPEWVERVRASLNEGIGRFGWSFDSKQNLLSDEAFEGKNKSRFLLELKPDDYVVYINMPSYGRCTMAKVTAGYYFTPPMKESADFNHRFKVDSGSVREFDRNSSIVPPLLSARLKLQNRYWRIYCVEEFEQLCKALSQLTDEESGQLSARTVDDGIDTFIGSIINEFDNIAVKLHRANPNFDLEKLMCRVFENMNKYCSIELKHGRGDKGADIILTYDSEDFPGFSQQKICLVQVKSFTGTMDEYTADAVDGLRKAFDHYENTDINANYGLIVSTATEVTPAFKSKIEKLQLDKQKDIGLLYGAELARFVLKYL